MIINLFNYKCISIGILIGVIFIFSNTITFNTIYSLNGKDISDNFKIIKTYESSFLINYNGNNILVYSKNKFLVNDYLKISGVIKKLDNLSSFNITNSIFLYLSNPEIEYLGKINTWDLLNKNSNINDYINLFFNKNDVDKNLLKTIKELNISHLFTISGFHFGIIYLLLNKLFKKIKFLSNLNFLIFFILFIYLIILNFPVSGFRALIFIFLDKINTKFLNKKYSKITILSFVFILFSFFNINLIFNYSFIFSFVITFVILISHKIINIQKYWIKNLLISLIAYISSIAISITFNESLSLLGYIYQLFFTPIIAISYLFSIFFFWTKYLSKYYFLIVDKLIFLVNKTNIFVKIKKTHVFSLTIHMIYFSIYFLFFNFEILKKWKQFTLYNHFHKFTLRNNFYT